MDTICDPEVQGGEAEVVSELGGASYSRPHPCVRGWGHLGHHPEAEGRGGQGHVLGLCFVV